MKVNFRLELKALDSTDNDKLRQWRNDYRIWRWCRQSDLISDVDQKRWFERQAADPTIKMYRIVSLVGTTETTVGVCGLTSIDWQSRRAEFSLYVGPEHQRQGYARQALSMLLDHGFDNLGLYQIWGETFEGNPALKLFTDLGMRVDGVRRQFYWKDGRFIDCHLVSMLAPEWRERKNHVVARSAPNSPDPSPTVHPDAVGDLSDLSAIAPPLFGASGREAPPSPPVVYEPEVLAASGEEKDGRHNRRGRLGARARGKEE